MTTPRTYHIKTLGCQMNVHDSERMAGLLDSVGLVPVEQVPDAAARATDAGDEGADVVVINTCSVRENAANKLYGNLGQLAGVKRKRRSRLEVAWRSKSALESSSERLGWTLFLAPTI